jgi:hypothetical protein
MKTKVVRVTRPLALALLLAGATGPGCGSTKAPDPGPGTSIPIMPMPMPGQALLAGHVSDEAGAPVAGATVTVAETDASTPTDAAGAYQLMVPADSTVTLVTAAAGFARTYRESVILAAQAMVTDFDVLLLSADRLTAMNATGSATSPATLGLMAIRLHSLGAACAPAGGPPVRLAAGRGDDRLQPPQRDGRARRAGHHDGRRPARDVGRRVAHAGGSAREHADHLRRADGVRIDGPVAEHERHGLPGDAPGRRAGADRGGPVPGPGAVRVAMRTYSWTIVAAAVAAGLGCSPAQQEDQTLARRVADALVTACPTAAPSDEAARAQCAATLSADKFLGGVMREPFLWGGQSAGAGFRLEDSNMNRFNVFVWRRMYLSLLMFPGDVTIETTGDGLTVAHVAYQFRNQLETGSYPYPFWHSKKKWDSYQLSREILLIFQNGQWIGAMRAADQDPARPEVAHTWSGQWRWQQGGDEMPYVSLYSYLLSPGNPTVGRLDSAYRALSDGMRQQSCLMCHSPDNYAAVKQLEFFNYPNQALFSRNSIITNLEKNNMPPANNALGLPSGVQNDADRQELLALAREFKAAGDAALAFEGELKPVN